MNLDDFNTADKDQAQAAMRDVAPIMGALYRGLREDGLSAAEAAMTAAAWVAIASAQEQQSGD